MTVDFTPFFKAINALEAALALPESDITRDASIQRFEFCIELAWKSAKKYMGTSATAPKTVVREMAQNSLIDDVQIWLSAIDHRNLSSHTYNEELAIKVYQFANQFTVELKALAAQLK